MCKVAFSSLQDTVVVLEPDQTRVSDEAEMLLGFGEGDDWGENTGEQLPTKLVEASRGEELKFMQNWQVWDEVPITECLQRTGKRPLGFKWVDINKADRTSPDVRSRHVAREIAYHRNDDFYAATPPLEALRLPLSIVASTRGCKVLVMDARKAHLYASVDR